MDHTTPRCDRQPDINAMLAESWDADYSPDLPPPADDQAEPARNGSRVYDPQRDGPWTPHGWPGDERPARRNDSRGKRRRKGDDDERPDSQATVLVGLALASGAELFRDSAGEAYATVRVRDHDETWRVRSRACKLWLWRLYHESAGKSPCAQAVADAMCALESRAIFDGGERAVHLRTAEHDGRVYIDLCDDAWRAVEIDADGWRVVDSAPVRFRRAKAMLALPTPVAGGKLDDAREYVNVDDDGWTLLSAWLVAAARPSGPYPAAVLTAEQGAGKSTTARLLRSLIDPSTAPIRCEPRDPRDLMIAATNGWIVALDNISYVQTWLSDALCRLATGGGFSTRTLYENDEETIFEAQRPAMLTGIDDFVTRGDLLDRSLIVHLPAIPEQQRRPEAELLQAWERDRPRIFGALLTAVSTALARLPDVQLDRLPRMADFALWATAAEPALGVPHGDLMSVYSANRENANSMILEDSIVAGALRAWMRDRHTWEGTAGVLLADLDMLIADQQRKSKAWPKSPRGLSGHLRRLAPNLRHVGIQISYGRTGRGNHRHTTIRVERADGGDGGDRGDGPEPALSIVATDFAP